jgi:hypothetical protein
LSLMRLPAFNRKRFNRDGRRHAAHERCNSRRKIDASTRAG